MRNDEKAVAGLGCVAVLIWIVWVGILIWSAINIVNWLITK